MFKAFDHEKARKEGIIIPQKGVNGNYDDAMAGVDMIKLKLDEYLQRQRKRLGCKVCEFTTFNRVQPHLNCDLLIVTSYCEQLNEYSNIRLLDF